MIREIKVNRRPSLVLRVFKLIFRIIRFFTHKKVEFDVPRHRRELDRGAWFMPRFRKVAYEKLQVNGLKAEWITPNKVKYPEKVLYYLHGGAYAVCSIETHRRLVARLAYLTGMKALMIEYRMAPEHPFPTAIDDAAGGFNWLLEQGYSSKNIVIGGDSAGGGLSVTSMLRLRDTQQPLPAFALLVSPWTDLEGTGESNITKDLPDSVLNNPALVWHGKLYAGKESLRHPMISPIYADLTGLPPLYIVVGEEELIYNDSTRLAEKADACGVNVTLEKWAHMFHVWQVYDFIMPEANASLHEMAKRMQQMLEEPVA